MAKRRYKLQEFVAHSGNVNCLNFGKKNPKIFITGGDDRKVNLWSVGKPTSLMSFYGHTSPVKSAAFDPEEVLVVAGASSGAIKLWDLDGRKIRTLIGHKSNCSAVQFHPFGEFFSSGSVDTNLKIWDIRKKGCIHTYKGHTRGISTLKFSPDGRWLASGGFDNVVKLWDLTAGKLLHSFDFHKGHIRSIEFHPREFLLATGSADKTVKFWDLETFAMVGSSRREATGVQSMTFHPDGRTLFCGLENKVKVHSWEPVICHDSVDMGWSTLGDLSIHDEKLLGGAYYENSAAVWVADVSLIEPYVTRPRLELHSHFDQRSDSQEDNENNDSIRTIYADSSSVNSITSETVDSLDAHKIILPPDSMGISTEWSSAESMQTNDVVPCDVSIVPYDVADVSRCIESFASSKASIGASIEAIDTNMPSLESFPSVVNENAEEQEKSNIKNVVEMFSATSSPALTSIGGSERTLNRNKRANSGKAKVSHGRTRSLVEKFERREKYDDNEIYSPNRASAETPIAKKQKIMTWKEPAKDDNIIIHNLVEEPTVDDNCMNLIEEPTVDDNYMNLMEEPTVDDNFKSLMEDQPIVEDNFKNMREEPAVDDNCSNLMEELTVDDNCTNLMEEPTIDDNCIIQELMQNHDVLLNTFRSRLTKLQIVRHFWEMNDVNGAINAMRKFPDYSVQADVVCVLIERMDVFTLDLFSCLLPVLIGLLESNMERHVSISLEMLLKLIAAYGALVRSAVSAPPPIGVDLYAEKRATCSKLCFFYLQNIQKNLPQLVKRGGSVARGAQQLNLLLQQL